MSRKSLLKIFDFTRKVRPTKFVVHVSDPRRRNSIERHGLLPHGSGRKWRKLGLPAIVYRPTVFATQWKDDPDVYDLQEIDNYFFPLPALQDYLDGKADELIKDELIKRGFEDKYGKIVLDQDSMEVYQIIAHKVMKRVSKPDVWIIDTDKINNVWYEDPYGHDWDVDSIATYSRIPPEAIHLARPEKIDILVRSDFEDFVEEKKLHTMKNVKTYESFVNELAKLIPGTEKIDLSVAVEMAESLIRDLGLRYVDPRDVDTRTEYIDRAGFPLGSIRRMKRSIGDLDIIITDKISLRDVSRLENVSNVSGGRRNINFHYRKDRIERKVNLLIFIDPDTFGAALLHVTGSDFYNIRLRANAKKKGYKLSEYGLELLSTGEIVAGKTEEEILKTLGVTAREATQR